MEAAQETAPTDWPASMIELADVLDVATTQKLMTEYGGRRIYVPSRPPMAQHRLSRLLGLEQARRLSEFYGGDEIVFSLGTATKRRLRNAEIIRRFDAGETVSELALAYELTTRMLYSILNR